MQTFSFTSIFYLEISIWSIEILFFGKVFLQKNAAAPDTISKAAEA